MHIEELDIQFTHIMFVIFVAVNQDLIKRLDKNQNILFATKLETSKVGVMRNGDILKSFKREINLKTKVVKDKTKYSRKNKHKGKSYD